MKKLSLVEPTAGSPPYITADRVLSSIQKMKLGKLPGHSGNVAGVLKVSPNAIVKEGKMSEVWNSSYIISLS